MAETGSAKGMEQIPIKKNQNIFAFFYIRAQDK